MVARGLGGKVGLVASVLALIALPVFTQMPTYTVAKGAVAKLTRELAIEYASKGIAVNARCHGICRTEIGNGSFRDTDAPSQRCSRRTIGL